MVRFYTFCCSTKIRKIFALFIIIFSIVYVINFLFQCLYVVAHGELSCFIDERTRANLLYMITTFDFLMASHNLSCWIDYGSLLGSYRSGSIINYDHDGDMGYLGKDLSVVSWTVAPILNKKFNISLDSGNPVQMEYNGTKVDLFVYNTYSTMGRSVPGGKTDQTLTRIFYRNSEYFEQTYSDVEPEWIFPLKLCSLSGAHVSCPSDIEKVLSTRYPYTFKSNLVVPFKFWCYANVVSFFKIVFYY